ncbi:MAG: dienelactone hydrolase family protein [Actinomycetota bacterium]
MGDMVSFASNGLDARGYLAAPETGSGPGVIVLQEWWGLNEQIKGVADRLAGEGFVALAPDLYHGELAGHDEMDKAGRLMSELPPERAAKDMSGAVDFLAANDATTGDGIGAIGFCMGGLMTMMVTALRGDKVRAAMPFYGFPAPDGEPDWSGLTAVVRGHMANPDDFFTPDAARALEAKLQAMGKDVQFTIHDAGHAFMNETNAIGTHDADLAAQVWPQVYDFFHAQLG